MSNELSMRVAVAIRRATLHDAALLAELGARTFSDTFAADNTTEDMAAYLASSFSIAQQTIELSEPNSTFFIAEIAGVPAGYAKLHAGPAPKGIEGAKAIELVRLYASREWHGRGVGDELMRACLDEAERVGHETIWLGVWERNSRAQSFYRRWKFQSVGHQIFQLGSDRQTDILMERPV